MHVSSRVAFLVYTYLHASKPAPPDQVSTGQNRHGSLSETCDTAPEVPRLYDCSTQLGLQQQAATYL